MDNLSKVAFLSVGGSCELVNREKDSLGSGASVPEVVHVLS